MIPIMLAITCYIFNCATPGNYMINQQWSSVNNYTTFLQAENNNTNGLIGIVFLVMGFMIPFGAASFKLDATVAALLGALLASGVALLGTQLGIVSDSMLQVFLALMLLLVFLLLVKKGLSPY